MAKVDKLAGEVGFRGALSYQINEIMCRLEGARYKNGAHRLSKCRYRESSGRPSSYN